MLFTGGNRRLVTRALSEFTQHLPGVRDGDEVAIHHTRVAIRRLRESLALLRSDYDEEQLADFERRLGVVFNALGRVRDADTGQRLIEYVEARLPSAPITLSRLRVTTSRRQLAARRRAIKALEHMKVAELVAELLEAGRAHRQISDIWHGAVRTHLKARATAVQAAIEHAGGVYFRKRSHQARVSIKQFRYALELAKTTGAWRESGALRALRKAQSALGDAHDREVLLKRLTKLAADGGPSDHREVVAIEQFLQGEILGFHRSYLSERPRVLDVAAACTRTRGMLPMRASAMAVAAIAIPVILARRRS